MPPRTRSRPIKLRSRPPARRILAPLMTLVVGGGIVIALWLVSAAIMENLKFAAATNQIIDVLEKLHTLGLRDPSFGQQPGDDVLERLSRAGLMNLPNGGNVALRNPWSRSLTVRIAAAGQIRIETTLPVQDCRRMAYFVLPHAGDFKLKMMDGASPAGGPPRRFFSYDQGAPLSAEAVLAACGSEPEAVLGMVFGLK